MNSHFLGEAKTKAVADSATGDRRGHVSLFLFIQSARRYREEYHVEIGAGRGWSRRRA
jgi:hypothetical protein